MALRILAVLCVLGCPAVVSSLQHAAPLTQHGLGGKSVLPEIDRPASHGTGPAQAAPKLRVASEASPPQCVAHVKTASAVVGGEAVRSQAVPFREEEREGLGRFHLNREDITAGGKLGEGAVGEIWRGAWKGHPVAIKTLKEGFGPESHEHADFMKECGMGVRLQHTNIVGVHGLVQKDKPVPSIVQELMQGGTVEQLLAQRHARKGCPWPPEREQVLSWCQDLARALAYLHGQEPKIVHRDIKPANLMLTADHKTLKLGDFGLSRAVDGGAAVDAHTMSGQVGTIRFMAPEVVSGLAHYAEKVDVYSAAMCMYNMATGEKPFSEFPDASLGERVVSGLRPSIKAVDCKPLAALIQRAWAVRPEDRPSAAEMLSELVAMEKDLREESSDPSRPRPSRSASGAAFGGGRSSVFSHIRM